MDRIPLCLSVAALAVALGALLTQRSAAGPEPPTPVSRPGPDLAGELERLAREVAHLRERPVLEAAREAVLEDEPRARAPAPLSLELTDLERRLARLEHALDPYLIPAVLNDPDLDALFKRFRRVEEIDLDAATELALSLDSTAEEKLEGLRRLRGQRLDDGADARTPEVVSEMIAFAQACDDPETRADVWRQLDDVTDPILRQPLLDALAHDPDPEVREEAAETLGPFLPDGVVEAALTHAAAHDQDEGVREQAQESLAGR